MSKKTNVYRLTKMAIVAAVYVVLTVVVPFPAYADVQFRFSEILVLLCFYNKDYCVSLTLGCAISNIFSPFALIDVPVGSLATLIAVILMWLCPNIYIASLFPVITNGLMVGASLTYVYNLPYWITAGTVALGEFAVVSIVGVIIFKVALERNSQIIKLIGFNKLFAKQKHAQ